MNIQNIALTDLHPYAKNPRKNDEAVNAVAASIREFGFLVPLVIDRGHEIVAGHTRYRAAKALGMKEVPCVIADELTEDQIKAFRLADNKVGELASWDMDLLPLELADIVMPMTDFGFEVISEDEFGDSFTLDEGEKKASLETINHIAFSLNASLDYIVSARKGRCNQLSCPLYIDMAELMAAYGEEQAHFPRLFRRS